MKKILLLTFTFITLSVISQSSPESSAENTLKVFNLLFNGAAEVRDLKNIPKKDKITYNYNNNNYNLYYGQAIENKDIVINTKLYATWDYFIIASGDELVNDIDMYIYDENNNVVSIDRTKGKICFPKINKTLLLTSNLNNNKEILGKKISVRPIKTGNYKIVIKVRNAKPKSYWTMLISSIKSK